MTNSYKCNKCGTEMGYHESKTILVDVGGEEQSAIHDVHICRQCRGLVLDYINTPTVKRRSYRAPNNKVNPTVTLEQIQDAARRVKK